MSLLPESIIQGRKLSLSIIFASSSSLAAQSTLKNGVGTSEGHEILFIGMPFVVWTGEKSGLKYIPYYIPKSEGTARIETLSALPLDFHPDEKRIIIKAVECGRLF